MRQPITEGTLLRPAPRVLGSSDDPYWVMTLPIWFIELKRTYCDHLTTFDHGLRLTASLAQLIEFNWRSSG